MSVLVAALVLARGAVVTSFELRSVMWPSDEPASAANQLHRLVGQARRLFEPGLSARDPGVFISGSSAGYRLDPRHIHSDLEDCDVAAERARRLSHDEEWDTATQQYRIALEVVRHPLLGDLALETAGHPGFSTAARARVTLATEALACALRAPRPEHVVALVEQIAAPLPFEEALQAGLIRALAQAERRRDAMSLYERTRNALVEELGVDPGPELRAAHNELLSLGDHTPAETSGQDLPRAGPAELPPPLRGMTARPEAQRLLDEIARLGEASAVVITSIGGMGGIGKTTLAVAWARSLAPRFPDGQLYVNLRGFDPAGQVMPPMEALRDLLLSLGETAVQAEESLQMRSARFRGVVADRKLLILLDNARDADQVRPLLPGTPGCLVIVTSRNKLAGLVVREGAVPLRLEPMTENQARDLLTRRLGAVRLGLEPTAVSRIISAAAGLPLALALVGARLVLSPELGLGAVADELSGPVGLAQARSPLSTWSAGEQQDDLATVFDWSYDDLDAQTARFFRTLAVHPGPELSFEAVASITGTDPSAARRAIARLVGASLLERRGPDRFVLHDLLREYAASRLDSVERSDAEARLVGHYVCSTRNAWDTAGRPSVGDLDPVATMSGIQAETFDDLDAATEWYLRERAVLPAVLHLSITRGWDRAAANLAIDWRPMNQTVEVDADTYPHVMAALAAAERTGDAVLRAELHRDVGTKAVRLGDPNGGQRHLEEARGLYALIGDRAGEANVLRNLSTIPTISRETAFAGLRTAIELVQDGEAPQVLRVVQAHLAAHLMNVGPDESVSREACLEAVALLSECLPVVVSNGWTHLVPSASITLSEALMMLSRPREALEVAVRGREFASTNPVDLAILHAVVAQAALATGERSVAAQACRDFRELVADHGRGNIEGLLAQSMLGGATNDPFAPVERVEAELAGQAAAPHP
ncbi:MAG: BTAD domain-containing putative transcriptional regulator [Lapillicoccus sp.]